VQVAVVNLRRQQSGREVDLIEYHVALNALVENAAAQANHGPARRALRRPGQSEARTVVHTTILDQTARQTKRAGVRRSDHCIGDVAGPGYDRTDQSCRISLPGQWIQRETHPVDDRRTV